MINLCKCRYFLIRNIWNDHSRFKNIMKYQCHYRSTDINSTLFQSLHKKCDIVRTSNQYKHVTFPLLLFFIIIQVNFASIQNCVCWNCNCSSWIFLMALIPGTKWLAMWEQQPTTLAPTLQVQYHDVIGSWMSLGSNSTHNVWVTLLTCRDWIFTLTRFWFSLWIRML